MWCMVGYGVAFTFNVVYGRLWAAFTFIVMYGTLWGGLYFYCGVWYVMGRALFL